MGASFGSLTQVDGIRVVVKSCGYTGSIGQDRTSVFFGVWQVVPRGHDMDGLACRQEVLHSEELKCLQTLAAHETSWSSWKVRVEGYTIKCIGYHFTPCNFIASDLHAQLRNKVKRTI